MAFFLGRYGSLVQLPQPGRGITPTLIRPSSTRQTIGGGQAVALTPGPGRRTWALSWASLTPDTASVLEAFYAGGNGFGPFVFLDPGRRNHLGANQSAATSVSNDTTGFTPGASETVASVTTPVLRGPRALSYAATSATAGILTLDPPTGLAGWPTPALATWTFSAQLRGGGADPTVTAGLALVWLDSAGATLSTTLGSAITTSSSAYAQVSASAAAPANAVGFKAQVRVTPGSITGSTIVYVDQPCLDLSSSVRAWVMGTGVPQVSITDNPVTYPWALPKRAATMALVEVG